jgi:hypothetical protein
MSRMGPAHHPFPWRRVGAVTLVMGLGVAILWAFIQAFDTTGVVPPDPTAAPPATGTDAATPALATPTAPSTPSAGPDWPAGSLPALLAVAPDRLADGSLPLHDIATYADIAAWMTAAGMPLPAGLDDPALTSWEERLGPLALPASLRERGLDPEWRRVYGFSLLDVDQVLSVGQAPDYVMVLRGRFDPAGLQAAWVASGYQAVEVEGRTAWSLFPGDAIDLSVPESRPAMGALNNVMLLEDGTLVAAARTSRLASVLQVVDGDAPSLADHEDVALLLVPGSEVETFASAVLAKGSLLMAPPPGGDSTVATPALSSPAATPGQGMTMPPVRLALFGIPADNSASQIATPPAGSGIPELGIVLVVSDLDAARQAREWIEVAWASQSSVVTDAAHGERLGTLQVRIRMGEDRGSPALVVMSATLRQGPADWLAIILERDLGFAAWQPEP